MLLVYMPGLLQINDQITIMMKEAENIVYFTKSQRGGL
jgi:hypothetical protein